MGPMPWAINAEIYPLRARTLGVSVAALVNWVGNLLVSISFLDLQRAITPYVKPSSPRPARLFEH